MQSIRIQSSLEHGIADKIIIFIGPGGYFGFSPVVPGTVGSLVGLMLYFHSWRAPISLVGWLWWRYCRHIPQVFFWTPHFFLRDV